MIFFGISVPGISHQDAINALEKPQLIFTPNPEILLKAKKNPKFKEALLKATLFLPDGHGLQLVSTLLQLKSGWIRLLLFPVAAMTYLFWKKPFSHEIPSLIHGSDFLIDLLRWSEKHEKRVFFLGGREKSAQKTAKYFKLKFPKLKICGVSDADPDEKIFKTLQKMKPEVLLVAYGAPKQEVWLAEYAHKLPGLFHAMAVGGSFDFYSRKLSRSPALLRKLGLEWLWRLILEPKTRILRIYRAVLEFPITSFFSS